MTSIVSLRDVTKSFRKGDQTITPLDHADLEVTPGAFVSLMGPSGSGKTTLLNLVAGIDDPTSGQVVAADRDLATLSRSQRARWRAANIGYVFQSVNLVPVLTAAENIELPLLLLPMGRAERDRRIGIALDLVGLGDRADHYPRQLSGGQEQRVGIARAIVADPKIVVADEPTGNLDAETAGQIRTLLLQINEQLKTTLLMVTHDPRAAAIASRRLQLVAGKFVADDQSAVGSTVAR